MYVKIRIPKYRITRTGRIVKTGTTVKTVRVKK